MGDLLRMDHINSLPQPFMVQQFGSDTWWPVYDLCVQTGMMRLDVCGMLDVAHFSDVKAIRDCDHNAHDPDDWYNEEETEETK